MAPQKPKSKVKTLSTSAKTKAPAKRALSTEADKKNKTVVAKPKVRVSRVSVGLGIKRPDNDSVVNLKGLGKKEIEPVESKVKPLSKTAKNYGSQAYDEDLDKGDFDFDNDDLADEPVESLGELLDDEEKLNYEDEVVAKTVNQKVAKPQAAVRADNGGRIYKRLAVGFIALVAMITIVVAYFILVKLKIEVSLKNEALTGDLTFNVQEQTSATSTLAENSVKGLVKKMEIEQSKGFTASGSEVIGEEVSGKMIIYNKYIKNQPLVATTRLLGADGQLFRLKNSVNVPAGGQVEVEVYADAPKADMVVGAEHFTVPGLWEGLQDKVYGESKAGDIAYKKKVKGIISQADIDKAIAEMKDVLLAEAKTEIENSYGDFNKQLYQLDETSVVTEVDSKAGEEKEQMIVKIKGSVTAVAFNGEDSLLLARSKAISSLGSGKELSDLKDEAISYEIVKADAAAKTAEIKASFAGQVNVVSLDNLIDRNKITNLNEDQLKAYLDGIPEIANYKFNFYPPFIKKAPALVDRIEIVLTK